MNGRTARLLRRYTTAKSSLKNDKKIYEALPSELKAQARAAWKAGQRWERVTVNGMAVMQPVGMENPWMNKIKAKAAEVMKKTFR